MYDTCDIYWAVMKASAGKLVGALNSNDQKELTRIGRAALDRSAPTDWCVHELKRLARYWEGLRRKYRGLHTGITRGLVAPPHDPTPEMVLGLLLNEAPGKPVAETKLAGMLKRIKPR